MINTKSSSMESILSSMRCAIFKYKIKHASVESETGDYRLPRLSLISHFIKLLACLWDEMYDANL